MDVTRTIRLKDASYREAMDLGQILEEEGVHVEFSSADQKRLKRGERLQREQAERGPALGVFFVDLNQVVINLVSTGTAVAIAAAVKKFRNRAPRIRVEVDGEEEDQEDSSRLGSHSRSGPDAGGRDERSAGR